MSSESLSRPTADAMGMLATVMNALVLEAAIERLGAPARTMSALAMPQVCETYERAAGAAPSRRGPHRGASPAAPAIRSSPPTRPRCCAPPRWAATRCSRPPMSTASTAPIPRRTRRPRATTGSPIRRRSTATSRSWMPPPSRLPARTGCLSSCSRSGRPARSKRCCAARASTLVDRLRSRRRSAGRMSTAGGHAPASRLKRSGRGPRSGRAPWQPKRTISTNSSAACRARSACSSRSSAACAPAAPRRTCSSRSRSRPMAPTCRSTRSRPSACRSRA